MQKLILGLGLILSLASNAAELNKPQQPTPETDLTQFHFKTPNDGYMFVFSLGELKPKIKLIHVDQFVHDAVPSDPVTVYCCAGTSIQNCTYGRHVVNPGENLLCHANEIDYGSVGIEGFVNGASGIYGDIYTKN